MRSSRCLALLAAAGWTVGVDAQNNNATAALTELSACVTQCSDQVLQKYDCTAEQRCFCDDDQLQRDISSCLISSECPFSDQLAYKKSQASTCDVSARNRGSMHAIVTYVFFGIAVVFTIARLLARWPTLQGAGYSWDDYVAVLCMASVTVTAVGNYFAVGYGLGTDTWGLDADQVKNYAMWIYITQTQYIFILFGTKTSMVCLYLRTWKTRDKFRSLCWITLALLTSALIAFEVVSVIQCLPIASQWNRFVDSSVQSRCIDRESWLWALAGTTIGFDCVVIILPISKLLKLKVSWSRKLGLCAVFLVGFAVTAMSILRMFYIHGFITDQNVTYNSSRIGLYSIIEAFLSQVCCCMPATVGLLRRSWNGKLTKSGSKTPLVAEDEQNPNRSASLEPTVDSPAIFGPNTKDPEKNAERTPEKEKVSTEYSSSHDSAPSPIIQRGSRVSQQLRPQPSVDQPLWKQQPPNRDTLGTATTKSSNTSWRTPDILYHDKQNQLRLEIHDPPHEPVKATLTYIDRFEAKHDVELQGRHQTATGKRMSRNPPSDDSEISSTTRPSSSPSPDPNRESAGDYVTFAGRKTMKMKASESRIDQLLKAHKALTEGSSVSDIRASLGTNKGDRSSRVEI